MEGRNASECWTKGTDAKHFLEFHSGFEVFVKKNDQLSKELYFIWKVIPPVRIVSFFRILTQFTQAQGC